MKKLITICLSILMAATMAVSAFAADTFVSSPSTTKAPELITGGSYIVITAYGDRVDLSQTARDQLEEAYNNILEAESIIDLNEAIALAADEKKVAVEDLAVSDLFDISEIGTSTREGSILVTLKAETLARFVCLLHYKNGEWEIIESAKVTENGTQLEFSQDEFSPFAIVVNTNKTPAKSFNWLLLLIICLLIIIILIILFIILKKKKKDEEEETENAQNK